MDALREALAVWIPEYAELLQRADDMLMEPLEKVVAAAAAYAEGREAWWCEEHGQSGKKPNQACVWALAFGGKAAQRSCRMVRVRVCVPYNEEG